MSAIPRDVPSAHLPVPARTTRAAVAPSAVYVPSCADIVDVVLEFAEVLTHELLYVAFVTGQLFRDVPSCVYDDWVLWCAWLC